MAALPETRSTPDPSRGVLFLVVGPSGVGKDALIDAMRARRPDLVYPQRAITRSGDAGGEAHQAMTLEAFDAAEAAGRFALSWRAHETAYGVPVSAAAALARGRSVLVNVSRSVIATARLNFPPVRVFSVTAPRATLARRLAGRGRESAEAIAARLARAGYDAPSGDDVTVIDNGGDLVDAADAMAAAIEHVIGRAPATPISRGEESDASA